MSDFSEYRSHDRAPLSILVSGLLTAILSTPICYRVSQHREAWIFSADRWEYLVLSLIVVLLAMSVFMILIPDRASIRLASFSMAFVAGLHATMLAVLSFAGTKNQLLANLDLADEFLHRRSLLWATAMVVVFTVAAIMLGRFASRRQG